MPHRSITTEEQRALLHTAQTPGFRLFCDLFQSEIDNTLGLLESFDLPATTESRYLGYMRAMRKILSLMILSPKTIQAAIRYEIDPNSTEVLFAPGAADGLDVDYSEIRPDEDPLAPHNPTNARIE